MACHVHSIGGSDGSDWDRDGDLVARYADAGTVIGGGREGGAVEARSG